MEYNMEYIEADSLLDGEYDRVLYDKFLEAYETDTYDILTPNGFLPIEGVGKTIEYNKWTLITTDKELICADKHIVYRCDNMDFETKRCDLTELFVEDIELGDFIMTTDGPEMVMDINISEDKENMFDLQISEGSNKQYYTNGILSHNSLWMQNFAVKSADMGHNVLYITLEMSERKVMKRLGAMRLKIPINDYDKESKDTELIKERIKKLSNENSGDLFDKKVGKILVKFWAAGTATCVEFDNYIQRLKEKKNIKID